MNTNRSAALKCFALWPSWKNIYSPEQYRRGISAKFSRNTRMKMKIANLLLEVDIARLASTAHPQYRNRLSARKPVFKRLY
jgi:hypothetical protein